MLRRILGRLDVRAFRRFMFLPLLLSASVAQAQAVNIPLGFGDILVLPGVSPSADLSLNVGTKLIFDADATANDYFIANVDGSLRTYINATHIETRTSAQVQLRSDILQSFGSANNYTLHYDSVATRLELNSLSGLVAYVDDGGLDVTFGGGLNLNENEGIIFDTNADANNFILGSDANIQFWVENERPMYLTKGKMVLSDLVELTLGTGLDYWATYNSAGTQFELWTTDADGIGTNGLVLSVADGTDDVDFAGAITVVGTGIIAGNNISSSGLFSVGTVRASGASSILWNGRTELFSPADGQLQIDQSDNSTGVTLDANTADTLTIKDQAGTGDGTLVVGGVSTSLTLGHDGTYHTITGDDPDGILLGTTGGSFNETLLIDFDQFSNYVAFESTTGAASFLFNGQLIGTNHVAGATYYYTWSGRTKLFAPADGQIQIDQNDNSTGVTLDALTADTLTIKDQAGTGDGHLVVTGVLSTTPSGDTALTAGQSLSVTNSIMRVAGSGGAVTLTSTPSIADATDGTCVKIQGTSDTNTLTLQDESNLANSDLRLSGGVDITLGQGDLIEVCYDSGDDDWYELTRSDNNHD